MNTFLMDSAISAILYIIPQHTAVLRYNIKMQRLHSDKKKLRKVGEEVSSNAIPGYYYKLWLWFDKTIGIIGFLLLVEGSPSPYPTTTTPNTHPNSLHGHTDPFSLMIFK